MCPGQDWRKALILHVMGTLTYFAYGSNMLIERLQARCPSARFKCPAIARGHALDYSKRSADGSGKATLIPVDGAESVVLGALFELSCDDLTRLDGHEGRGQGYDRLDDFRVEADGGPTSAQTTAVTYIAGTDHVDTSLHPYDWYRALVLAGAHQHGHREDYIRSTLHVPCLADPLPERPSRTEALTLLRQTGFEHFLNNDGLSGRN